MPGGYGRVIDVLGGAFERMPALEEVGIYKVVNGPITYTIDGAPLVGPIPGKRNAFCIIGLRAGLGEGGGHGWMLAQQIVHGEACYDTWCIDLRRFTGYANTELTALKAIEDYQNEFRFHLPHEHRPAGRPIKTTPLTPILAAKGAEFTTVNGWERADYYKPAPGFSETYGYHFNETFDVVASEIKSLQSTVGITEVNGFNRFEITGEGAHDFLDYMICGRVTRKSGRVGLGYLLNHLGNVKAEATIANFEDGRIWYGSAAASEYHDFDWLSNHLPKDGSVKIKSLTNDYTILVIAGPKSRELLSKVSRDDWSKEAFPWLSVKEAYLGIAPAVVMSVSFSGEQAYELHIPNNQLYAAYLALLNAGEDLGIIHFGSRAVESMRLEKGYRHWKSDLITEYDPYESSLERFVNPSKPKFVGKAALESKPESEITKRFVTMIIDYEEAPAQPGTSIRIDENIIGTVTSGEWGHRINKNIALAFIETKYADIGSKVSVDILGQARDAVIVEPKVSKTTMSLMIWLSALEHLMNS